MMSRFKTFLTAAALACLSGVTILAAVKVVWTEPPDWSGVDHAALRDRLATQDVSKAPPAEQQKLIWRLEQDFRTGTAEQWDTEVRRSPPDQRQRMLDNFDELARLWLTSKVEAWWSRPEKERDRYLDRELEGQASWRFAIPNGAGITISQTPAELFPQLVKRVEAWQAKATAAERQRTQKFIAAVQRRFFQRQLPWMFPGGDR